MKPKIQTELKFHNGKWIAYYPDLYGGECSRIGTGDTEQEAIDNLKGKTEPYEP
jgi:predicted RNase H-like HicB family nuclease